VLAAKTYPQDHIDACRARMDAQLATYRTLAASADPAAVEAFAPVLFANLVLALDGGFVHRTRGVEGKDGNPLNEVRMLCTSILQGDVLLADSTIKYKPEASVLGLAIGDEIRLDEPGFTRLAEAFHAEIERRFT